MATSRPLPLGNCAPFPAPLSLFSSAPEKDVTTHRPETGINFNRAGSLLLEARETDGWVKSELI